jgi:AhpD family alkylhydroperoxidase
MQARMNHPAMVVPDAMKALQTLGELPKRGLPEKLLELVHLRASQINGCSACVDMHPKLAKKAGETDERLFSVAAWREAPYFTEAERAALALTEALTRLSDRADPVPDAVWSQADKQFDEAELAALILAIANINVWNRLNVAVRQPAGRVEGMNALPFPQRERVLLRQKRQHGRAIFLRRLVEHPVAGGLDNHGTRARNMRGERAVVRSQSSLGVAAADEQGRGADR